MVIHGVEYTRSEVFTVCLTMKRLPMWMVKTAACLLLRAHDTRCLQLRKHGFPPSKKKKKKQNNKRIVWQRTIGWTREYAIHNCLKPANHSEAQCFLKWCLSCQFHPLKKSWSIQSKRRLPHWKWLYGETNDVSVNLLNFMETQVTDACTQNNTLAE